MKKSLVLFFSVILLTGCSRVSDTVDTSNIETVYGNEAINYTYSEDKKSVIVEVKRASNDEQVTVMQTMAEKGYKFASSDTVLYDDTTYIPMIVNMYFQKVEEK